MALTRRSSPDISVRWGGYLALVLPPRSELSDVDLSELESAVGARSLQRGRSYARAKRVLSAEWDPSAQTLTGSVVGNGARYDTAAFFVGSGSGALAFEDGECTCPVGHNCKHVAAIVIAATDARGGARPGRAARMDATSARTARPAPSWETSLRALMGPPPAQTVGSPLAIELALRANGVAGQGAPRLLARLMRPGARGGWVNGSLTWNGLDSWQVRDGGYRADHLAIVRELYAVHRARDGRSS